MSDEYVLGTQSDELHRLGFQHRLWSDAAHALWRRARIGPGQRVLDVGCGPGFASFDLAQLVGPIGLVQGADLSASFIEAARAGAAARGLGNIRCDVHDVQALPELGSFDLAWARWLLCFVPDPEAVVAGVARNLRPGGQFCVHDYFNYASMTSAPRVPVFTKVVEATARSWRAHGGDPDVAGRLPAIFARNGLDLVHLDVHQRIARPGETMWHWADTWWRNYTPKLVTMGEITESEGAEMLHTLDTLAANPTAFLVMPPVYELLAVKR